MNRIKEHHRVKTSQITHKNSITPQRNSRSCKKILPNLQLNSRYNSLFPKDFFNSNVIKQNEKKKQQSNKKITKLSELVESKLMKVQSVCEKLPKKVPTILEFTFGSVDQVRLPKLLRI